MGEKRYRLPMCTKWSFAAKTCVGSDAPVHKISIQEDEEIESPQEVIFMNFKFGRSFSNFSGL